MADRIVGAIQDMRTELVQSIQNLSIDIVHLGSKIATPPRLSPSSPLVGEEHAIDMNELPQAHLLFENLPQIDVVDILEINVVANVDIFDLEAAVNVDIPAPANNDNSDANDSYSTDPHHRKSNDTSQDTSTL